MCTYSIGIDLGTTNSAVSYFKLADAKARGRAQTMLAIPQIDGRGHRRRKAVAALVPLSAQRSGISRRQPRVAVGQEAAKTASWVNLRGRTAAKSRCGWFPRRKAGFATPGWIGWSAILPWQAPEDVQRVSPLEASARYLTHFARLGITSSRMHPLAEQDVVLTVPASFDAAARDLTLKAAQQAGLPNVTLIEEPQAAFYAWIEQMGEGFRKHSQARRRRAGGGRRRRHHRFFAHCGDGQRRRRGADACCRGRSHSAGWRQHGSGARAHGQSTARRRRQETRCMAIQRPDVRVPPGQGTTCSPTRNSKKRRWSSRAGVRRWWAAPSRRN